MSKPIGTNPHVSTDPYHEGTTRAKIVFTTSDAPDKLSAYRFMFTNEAGEFEFASIASVSFRTLHEMIPGSVLGKAIWSKAEQGAAYSSVMQKNPQFKDRLYCIFYNPDNAKFINPHEIHF